MKICQSGLKITEERMDTWTWYHKPVFLMKRGKWIEKYLIGFF